MKNKYEKLYSIMELLKDEFIEEAFEEEKVKTVTLWKFAVNFFKVFCTFFILNFWKTVYISTYLIIAIICFLLVFNSCCIAWIYIFQAKPAAAG